MIKWLQIFVLVGALLGAVSAAHADDGGEDQDQARTLLRQGAIRPLAELLAQVQLQYPGDVVAVELLQLSGRWIYRLQVVAADGHRSIVDVDAQLETIVLEGDEEDD